MRSGRATLPAWAAAAIPLLSAALVAAPGCGAGPRAQVAVAEPAASVASAPTPERSPDAPPSSAILGVGAPEVGGPVTGSANTSAPSGATQTAESAPSPSTGSSAPKSASAKADRSAKITARHVLVQWMGCDHAAASVVRTRDQAHLVIEEVLRRAKAGEDFARLAVEFSDEPNAGARGGSLGRFGHGQMVRAFEDAAFALAPGEISGIVETAFGFHVIQRLE